MRSICFCVAALWFAVAPPAAAARQSLSQHGELLREGTITDLDGAVWNIRFIPGTRKIHRDAGNEWRDAGDSMTELVGRGLWLDVVPEAFVDGIDFSHDVVVDHFADGIVRDVRTARSQNRELRSGDFGRGFIVSWNWAKATTKIVARTVWLPVGSVGGATYALVAPVGEVAWRPLESIAHATVGGMLIPALVHLWNGTAWSATFANAVPERETRWVKRSQTAVDYVLDTGRLEAFLGASVDEHLSARDIGGASDEIARLEREIRELRNEMRTHQAERTRLASELRDRPAVRSRESVRTGARGASHVLIGDEARAWYADDEALDAAIVARLGERGLAPAEAEVVAIRKAFRRDVEAEIGAH